MILIGLFCRLERWFLSALNSNLSELAGRLENLITVATINTVAPVKQGFQLVQITPPVNTEYTWYRIETACSGFVTVMNGSNNSLAVESSIANTISITFVSTFIGIKRL